MCMTIRVIAHYTLLLFVNICVVVICLQRIQIVKKENKKYALEMIVQIVI